MHSTVGHAVAEPAKTPKAKLLQEVNGLERRVWGRFIKLMNSLNLNFEDHKQDVNWNGITGEPDAKWGK